MEIDVHIFSKERAKKASTRRRTPRILKDRQHSNLVMIRQTALLCFAFTSLGTHSSTVEAARHKCFESNNELRLAIEDYLSEPANRRDRTDAAKLYGYPIDTWCVNSLEDFSYAFWNAQDFNEPIGSWSTSNAVTMEKMFMSCTDFNQDISSWDVVCLRNSTILATA